MANEGLKLVVRGLLPGGDEWRNVFFYQGTADFTDTTISNWCTGLYNTIRNVLVGGWTVYGVDVAARIDLTVPTNPKGWGASDFVSVAVVTGGSGDALPPADCACVIARTNVKHVMARKFISGLSEANQSAGVLDSTVTTALLAFGAYWQTPTASPGSSAMTACAWGPTHGWVPIIGHKASAKVFHLERRQKGRGI